MRMINMLNKQQGAALVVSLLVLLVMTMIGLAAVQTNVLEEKMAGNTHDKNLAFQAAEAGLRAAENALSGLSVIQLTNCEVGDDMTVAPGMTVMCYEASTDPEPDPLSHATWDDMATGVYTLVDAADFAPIGNQAFPKYYIMSLGRQASGLKNLGQGTGKPSVGTNVLYFRITARGTGGSDNAQSVLRSYFARRI